MDLPTLIYLIGMPIGFVIGARFGYRMMFDEDEVPTLAGVDSVMAMFLGVVIGTVAAFVWPIMLVVALGKRFLFFSAKDRHTWDLARKEQELDERERHIRELEHEAGIPPSHSFTKPGRFRT